MPDPVSSTGQAYSGIQSNSVPLQVDIVLLDKDCTPRAGFTLPDNPFAFPPSMVVIPAFAGMTSAQ